MDDLQDALNRYMVRRSSLRRSSMRRMHERNGENSLKRREISFTSAEDNPQYSFLKSNSKSPNNDSFFDVGENNKYDRSVEKLSMLPGDDATAKPFDLSNVRGWSKPLKNSLNGGAKSTSDFDESGRIYSSMGENSKSQDGPAQLLKIREVNLEIPQKMIAELKNIEISEQRPVLENLSLDQSGSSITSLTEAIKNLEVQIKNLELRPSVARIIADDSFFSDPSERLYPVLEETKFHRTGYTPKKHPSPEEIISPRNKARDYRNNDEERRTRDFDASPVENFAIADKTTEEEYSPSGNKSRDDFYCETPKLSRKIPVMESTRKSLHSDSTKIKFSTPTRVDPNSISTIGNTDTPELFASHSNNNNSINNNNNNKTYEISNDDSFNRTIPYEVEHFLEDALGDEFLNSTNMTYATCEVRDRTDSHFTASELISQDQALFHRKLDQTNNPPMTEPSAKHWSPLNRSREIYRSFSQRIKQRFRSEIKTEEGPQPPTLPAGVHETDKIRELLQEVNIQQTLINQATKALNLCNSMKEFTDSSERIESERLLLLASLRRKSVVEEIKKITSEETNRYERIYVGQKGEITISDVKLNLQESYESEIGEEETDEWFILVVYQGSKIWATRPVSCRVNSSKISFQYKIIIPNLKPCFKIRLEAYSMKVRKSNYNHEEKYRIHRRPKRSTSCPPCPSILVSPTSLLKKVDKPSLSPKIQYNQLDRNKKSSFTLCGFVELFLHDLSLSSPWPLMMVPANSILQGTIDLCLSCRLHLSVNHEGFVNHGDEIGGLAVWNRRWCVLKGHTLMFWNYPREQESKEPLKTIDLINCISSKVTNADRTICSKRRTLLFETVRLRIPGDKNSTFIQCMESRTIVRNLISLDTVKELMDWSTKLNEVIMALREWNVINVKNELQISDL